MDAKQKKQLITISLAGAVLLAGLVAGFLVVQNRQFIQNKASEGRLSCIPLVGTCVAPAGYTIVVKEEGGSGRTFSGTGTVNFDAFPGIKYTCEIISTTDSSCRSSADMTGPVCVGTDTGITPQAPTAPPVIPKPSDTPVPTAPARTNVPSTTTVPLLTTTATPTLTLTPTTKSPTATPTTKPSSATSTPTSATPTNVTLTGLPTTAPTATAAAQATKTAATATQAAAQSTTTNPTTTKTASSTSLPASGNVHPALIFGMLSVFIIVLGLLF